MLSRQRRTFSAQTPEDTILFNASGRAIKKATIREVFSGILTFSGAATNEQFTGDPPEETILFVANGDAHTTRARDKVGTGLASLSGIASCREIANYGYYGDDRDPGTSGLITISGSTLADPDSGVTYIPHYGIERNIGVGTTGIQIEPRTRFGFNTGFDADGNERGARYYSNVYPRNDVAELDGGSGTGGFRLNDDKELTFTRALLPYKASGLGVFSGTGNEALCIVGYEGDAGTTFFSGVAETRQIDVFGFYGDDADPGTTGLFTISTQTQGIVFRRSFAHLAKVLCLQLAETRIFNLHMDIRAKVKYPHFLEAQKHSVRTKYRMLFFTRLMVMVPRVLLHNQPKIQHNLRIKVNSNRKEQPSPTLVKLHSQQQLVELQNLLKEMSSEQFCSPSTLEQQILKSEKLILVFPLIEMTLHSMHSSNRLKMLRELFSLTLQILQKQYSILSKYTMVMVQLHYLVHIQNSSSLQHMLVLVDLQNMELQSRNKYLVMWAKVPSIHLLGSESFARESTAGTILYSATGSATTRVESDFIYASAGTFLPTGAATETRYVPLPRFWNNHSFWRTHSSRDSIHSRSYNWWTIDSIWRQHVRTLLYHLHLVVSSVLDLETKHTQEILMSVSEV